MLLNIDIKNSLASRVRGERLNAFGIDERQFQEILFRSLDRLLPDDELLLIMQSRHWQEEPDLMALDKNGKLYIFELKAWESKAENLLQVLRYGQLFGSYKYQDLQRIYEKFDDSNRLLKFAHNARFEIEIEEKLYNQNQAFIIMTNGLDYKTREAIQYWRRNKLDIRPWIYRVYHGDKNKMLLEISRFSVEDNPYEDLAEGFYILNTNYRNDPIDHQDMVDNKKAAAYYNPWKYKIERLSKGDIVFLYKSGIGIVAVGTASGKLDIKPYQSKPTEVDEEYSMKLNKFNLLKSAITPSQIKELTGIDYRFMSTMFAIDANSGNKLYSFILKQNK